MLDLKPADADAVRRRTLRAPRDRPQPTLIEGVGHEATDLRMHPPGFFEEQAKLLRDRLPLTDHVLQHARTRALWMDALRDLRQLERIPEQDKTPRSGPTRERVGEAVLAC